MCPIINLHMQHISSYLDTIHAIHTHIYIYIIIFIYHIEYLSIYIDHTYIRWGSWTPLCSREVGADQHSFRWLQPQLRSLWIPLVAPWLENPTTLMILPAINFIKPPFIFFRDFQASHASHVWWHQSCASITGWNVFGLQRGGACATGAAWVWTRAARKIARTYVYKPQMVKHDETW